jgi:hypothetical protein
VRFPSVYYQMAGEIAARFPALRPAQQAWLALWVFGAIQAKSATQSAVVAALSPWRKPETLRQYLREGLYDGGDRAAPCSTEIDIGLCFPLLFAWALSLWEGESLPLALDATLLNDDLVSLSVSLLYRGSACPVAWTVLPANSPGEWRPHLLRMLSALAPAGPKRREVVVMTDRGLWCPALFRALVRRGWHPLMRLHPGITFAPCGGGGRRKVGEWLRGPGSAFLARGVAFRRKDRQLPATLWAVWEAGEAEPWVLLTDLPPDPARLRLYGLRFWIESGFRALKSLGWQWQRTRRRDPKRVERHWLVMAVAQLFTLAAGTPGEAAEEAAGGSGAAGRPRSVAGRGVSLFRRGLAQLGRQFLQGRLELPLKLIPEPWPAPPWLLPGRITCIT